MRAFYLLFIATLTLIIPSCSNGFNNNAFASTSSSFSPSEVKEHSYSEIEHLLIEIHEIFYQNQPDYYCYFYASWCAHCNSIKNEVIEYALLQENIFFLNEPTGVQFSDNAMEYSLGCSSTSCLFISGYPSLIEIKNNTVAYVSSDVQSILKKLY